MNSVCLIKDGREGRGRNREEGRGRRREEQGGGKEGGTGKREGEEQESTD
jgi:hypothetical protein